MADNTCHFGINNFFADGGIPGAPAGLNFQPAQPADPDGGDTDHGDTTRLYFPGDPTQFAACVKRVFQDPGLRFVFSNRSGVPHVLTDAGEPFYSKGYSFEPGKDDVIREGSAGYIVSFGSTLYRALAAVETLRSEGVDVGLINKATLNVPDEDCLKKIGSTGFVIVAEEFNIRTGLGSRFGTWLLERGHTCRYAHLGTWREGSGGLWRQMGWQGLDPEGIADAARRLNG
jgi:transketolase C-terminal domain/subunit